VAVRPAHPDGRRGHVIKRDPNRHGVVPIDPTEWGFTLASKSRFLAAPCPRAAGNAQSDIPRLIERS